MEMIPKETLEQLRKDYPTGCRVKLLKMDDCQAPPLNTEGTVLGVDDIGSIKVAWDSGGQLSVVYGEDKCTRLDPVTTICYRQKTHWESREQAKNHFLQGMLETEGAEHERYTKIYYELLEGSAVATDED